MPQIDEEKNSDRNLLEINQNHRKQIKNLNDYHKILLAEKSIKRLLVINRIIHF